MHAAYYSTWPALRVVTYGAAVVDADGIVESLASSASAVELTDAELDGAEQTAGGPRGRLVTVTTTADVGSYTTTDPILVTGTDMNGGPLVVELLLTDEDGGETISSTVPMDTITQIDIPAQNDTDGAFTFGVGDIVADQSRPIRQFRGGAAGVVHCHDFQDRADLTPCTAGEKHIVLTKRIVGATTTANPVSVYY